MRAITFAEHGAVDLKVTEIPTPEPGPGDCLLKVKAVSLNGFDPMVMLGIPTLRTPLPMIPGADIAQRSWHSAPRSTAAAGTSASASRWCRTGPTA